MKKNQIILFFSLLLLSSGLLAQVNVSGTVYSKEDGTTLPGVAIMEESTKKGTATDENGNFTLTVSSEQSTLSFSYVGMISQKIMVGKQLTMRVELESSRELDEVVVIGYGTTRKQDFTGSLSSLKSDEIKKSKGTSFMDALQGKVAGVQVTSNSGEPGAGMEIVIRGGNSVNAGSQPLYIIDDVQIDINSNEVGTNSWTSSSQKYNPLAGINPSDIESIEVLKDASATAIFGSRGANGVVIVTTKKGGGEKTSIDLDVSYGFASARKKMKMLQGQDYADFRFARDPANKEWGIDTNEDGILDQVRDVSGYENNNWQDLVLRTALVQNYNVGITTGGNSKTKLSSSFGYLNQQGIIDMNKYERYTGRMNGDVDISKKLTVGSTINFSHAKSTGAVTSSGGNSFNGLLQSFILYKPIFVSEYSDDSSNPENQGLSNPINFLTDSYKTVPLTRIMLDGYARYEILKDLSVRASGGATLTNSKTEEWYPSTTSWGYTPKGLALISEANTQSWQTSNTISYNKQISKIHYINAMVGFELAEYVYNSLSTRAEGFENQSYNPVFDIGQAGVYPNKIQSYKESSTRESEFGRLNYTLLNRYLLTGTLRRDGSSKFGKDQKYAYFPSGAFAWRMEQEDFLKNHKVIDQMKLRVSYGASGNERIPSYRSLAKTEKTYYGSNNNSVDLGLAPAEMSNPILKWETTYQTNIGTDIQLFKSRINLTVDLYKKITRDMLLHADVPSQIGSYKQWQNIGRVDNKGIEIALNTVNISTKDFAWTTGINFNMNRNKVISLGNVSSQSVSAAGGHIKEVGRILVGQPLGSGWGYVYDGIYQQSDFNSDGTLKPGVASFAGVTVKPGDMKFKDIGGNDNIIDPKNDKTIVSNSDPKHFGGLTNTFNYKSFDLSAFLQWSYGNDIINVGRYRYEGYDLYNNASEDYWQNKWTPENPTNKYPSLTGLGKTEMSSYYVEDGSYLRLKNVTLGYNIPTSVCSKIKVQSLRVYFASENLITWTNYSGFDPEVSYWDKLISGLDYVSYPRAKTFTIGFSVKF